MLEKFTGLTSAEAKKRQEQYGKNELEKTKKPGFFKKILKTFSEPMFLLLIIAASVYFILGEPVDGVVMLIFVLAVISIQIVQERKTDKTLAALKDLSAPRIKVIRDGAETVIPSADLVPGDIMIIKEGDKIPADGFIAEANDLCADESSLTGESAGVWKTVRGEAEESGEYWRKDFVYAGTLVTKGLGYIEVEKTGAATEFGKIGKAVASASDRPTPLEKQTRKIIKTAALVAAVFVVLVGVVTFFTLSDHAFKERITESILSGITLAMSVIPEEIPLILTIFLSMGAWRLARKNSLIRKMPVIETLGAISVLCVDKTGTITKNIMTLTDSFCTDEINFNLILGRACESKPYDPMEKAMLAYCSVKGLSENELFGGELLYEYAFTDELKMMGHVWKNDGKITICAKGSPESILTLCAMPDTERIRIENKILEFSKKGLRVIAVAQAEIPSESEIPENLTDCRLVFSGLAGLMDPPKDTVKADIAECVNAKIKVVMVTGDNGITASSIAREIGMPNCENVITGAELSEMSDEQLRECVKTVCIFSRVLPEHKMRIVKAFQANGEIVAMTGDGVNDAAALKYSDIGIAMGKRGSEVSREAADMVLLDDNFSTIVSTIRDGRRIYQNIKKGIGYVFTIHIPIALAALIVTMLGIAPANYLLLPFHVVLLELIIDPTCSIVLERQPAERDIMRRAPRKKDEALLGGKFMVRAVLQGLVIFAASFGAYLFLNPETSAATARTVALTVMIFSNLFLVLVNNGDSIISTIKSTARDKVMWIAILSTVVILLLAIYTPLNDFLKLSPLSAVEFFASFGLAAAATLWYEIVKFLKKRTKTAKPQ